MEGVDGHNLGLMLHEWAVWAWARRNEVLLEPHDDGPIYGHHFKGEVREDRDPRPIILFDDAFTLTYLRVDGLSGVLLARPMTLHLILFFPIGGGFMHLDKSLISLVHSLIRYGCGERLAWWGRRERHHSDMSYGI